MSWLTGSRASHVGPPWDSEDGGGRATMEGADAQVGEHLTNVAALSHHGAVAVDEVAGGEFVDDRIRKAE